MQILKTNITEVKNGYNKKISKLKGMGNSKGVSWNSKRRWKSI